MFRVTMDICATALFTISAMALVVNGKKSYQQEAHPTSNIYVESRSANTKNEKYADGTAAPSPASMHVIKLGNETSHPRNTVNSTLEVQERIIWNILTNVITVVFHVLKDKLFQAMAKYAEVDQGDYTCHRNVCFYPQFGLGLSIGGPKMPSEENTTFLFFDNSTEEGVEVNDSSWKDFFANYTGDISKPLTVIIHGLNGSRYSPWAVTMRESLFKNVNCNVLVVDWQERARFPYYSKAASSTALVGVLLSFLLQEIIKTSNCTLLPSNVHLIGFSLGAHAAGVCGRHFYNTTGFSLGRISALDPAGPLFEKSNMCLSENDAEFVDVIHTNAGKLTEGRLGLNRSIGHVDFYPNGGSDQPGCKFIEESQDFACSHKRAQALYTESLFTNCSFKSFYCEKGWDDFEKGSCTNTTNSSLIGEMGYYSINKNGTGNQYLRTNSQPPYCILPNSTQSMKNNEKA